MRTVRCLQACAATWAMLIAATPSLAMGLIPNCLDTLRDRTGSWSECARRFEGNARECKAMKANMWANMQECERKGYEKAEIDAAMAAGARAAGRAKPEIEPPPAAPTPRTAPGPVPRLVPPREDDDG